MCEQCVNRTTKNKVRRTAEGAEIFRKTALRTAPSIGVRGAVRN
jgi:hypothetical protein